MLRSTRAMRSMRQWVDAAVIFSSIAAIYGNRGQAAYAMANEVLNRVAQAEAQRRGASCIVRSIAWGPWKGGMVTPALEKHFAKMNVPLIGLEEGARAFAEKRDPVWQAVGRRQGA